MMLRQKPNLIAVLILLISPLPVIANNDDEVITRNLKVLIDGALEIKSKNIAPNRAIYANETREAWWAGNRAYLNLVLQGETGWRALSDLRFNVHSTQGDLARAMSTSCSTTGDTSEETEKNHNQLIQYYRYHQKYYQEKLKNETWSLLYAHAEARCLVDDQDAMYSSATLWVMGDLKKCSSDYTDVDELLGPISHLRIHFLSDDDFPGHKHPWQGTPAEKAASAKIIKKWSLDKLAEMKQKGQPLMRPN